TVQVWDASTGMVIITLPDHGSLVMCAEFSPNGEQLATISLGGSLKVWDLKSATVAFSVDNLGLFARPAWNLDNERLAVPIKEGIKVFNVHTRQELFTLRGWLPINVDWSRDGQCLIARLQNGVQVWDASVRPESLTLAKYPSSDPSSGLTWDRGSALVWDP